MQLGDMFAMFIRCLMSALGVGGGEGGGIVVLVVLQRAV